MDFNKNQFNVINYSINSTYFNCYSHDTRRIDIVVASDICSEKKAMGLFSRYVLNKFS